MPRLPEVESHEDGLHVKVHRRGRVSDRDTFGHRWSPDLATPIALGPSVTDFSSHEDDPHPPLIGINGRPGGRSLPPRRGVVRAALDRLGDVRPEGVLLATDFDGTLAPIVPRPDAAEALPENIFVIDRLIELGVHVAVISGRANHDLRVRVPVSPTRILGENGMGQITEIERSALVRFNRKVDRLVGPMPGVWMECKPGITSLHYRSAPDAGPALLTAVLPIAHRFGLAATRGRMVIEVAPRRCDKSRAMAVLIAGIQPKAVIYAGDDEPDRSVFRLLRDSPRRHLAVGVSSEERPVESFQDCDLVVEGPEGMADFLHRLLERVVRHQPD